LAFYDAQPVDELAWPEENQDITMRTSALEVFTDFNQYKPLVIESTTSAIEARSLMQKAHVRLKMVVDSKDHFLGVISFDDLDKQAVIAKVSEGYKQEELCVTDFMRRRFDLKGFSYSELAKSRISDVVNALKGSEHQHCLVIDRETHKIRGIISASDIARKLHLQIDIENSSSFLNIFKALHH
jgi:CBS domain containing-hemolysin-like protein